MSPLNCMAHLASTDSSDTRCRSSLSASCRGNGVGTYRSMGLCPTIPLPRPRFNPLPSCIRKSAARLIVVWAIFLNTCLN